jgi:hypothetical protein
MKKKLRARIPVAIETEIVSNGKTYAAVAGNLSDKGIFIEINPMKTATPFIPMKKIELKLKITPKKTLNVKGEIIWLHCKKTATNSLTNYIGLEIINPSSEYKKFFKSL